MLAYVLGVQPTANVSAHTLSAVGIVSEAFTSTLWTILSPLKFSNTYYYKYNSISLRIPSAYTGEKQVFSTADVKACPT